MKTLGESLTFYGRTIVVVEIEDGTVQAFYLRTGQGGKNTYGAQAGDWAPFDGIKPNGWFIKDRYLFGKYSNEPLHRFGTEQNKGVSDWLKEQSIGEPREIPLPEPWGVNEHLASLGFNLDARTNVPDDK